MTSTLYLSRARLRTGRGEALSAIAPILLPDNDTHRTGHAHRVVWLLFQDKPDTARDFLWRDGGDGRFMILSHRLPTDPHHLFELETKPFAPELDVGDALHFALRANPTVARKGANETVAAGSRPRGKRVDVVMDHLHLLEPEQRAQDRDRITKDAGRVWMLAQGQRAGFDIVSAVVNSYAKIDIADQHRRGRRARAGLSIMDIEGTIRVTDPAIFTEKLARGFGSGKAFGCGLMLIRRAD